MIGEYSPQLGEHLTTISNSLDGQNAEEQITANVAGGQVSTDKRANKNFSDSGEKELTRRGIKQPRMQRNVRADHNQNDYSNASWFSFGIDPMILEQNPIPSHQENSQVQGKAQMHENANEQHTSIHREQTQVQTNVQNPRNNNQHTQGINEVWQAKDKQQPLQQAQHKKNADQNQPGNRFPNVSSNFEQQNPNQRGRADINPSLVKEKQEQPQSSNAKKDHVPEPAPYTVVQTYAAKLRHNQSKMINNIKLTTPELTSKQGLPAMLFEKKKFWGN
ncbi:hypothetical protein KY285_000474 [Solanum tuberosum]|nr:hypothetical protein KY285_000474 [Solanum tuberosum]